MNGHQARGSRPRNPRASEFAEKSRTQAQTRSFPETLQPARRSGFVGEHVHALSGMKRLDAAGDDELSRLQSLREDDAIGLESQDVHGAQGDRRRGRIDDPDRCRRSGLREGARGCRKGRRRADLQDAFHGAAEPHRVRRILQADPDLEGAGDGVRFRRNFAHRAVSHDRGIFGEGDANGGAARLGLEELGGNVEDGVAAIVAGHLHDEPARLHDLAGLGVAGSHDAVDIGPESVKPRRSSASYVKGTVPGIRENGGNYHAATWVVLATALQGRGGRAMELWNLINPVYHATTIEEVQRYKVEPYVVCADVYGAAPHTGRGGWTWYTGSASWLYRVAIERILGFQLRGDTLRFEPCIPPTWPGFSLTFRHRSATYRIVVDNSAGTGRGVRSIELDGQGLPNHTVPLSDDGKTHSVRVQLG